MLNNLSIITTLYNSSAYVEEFYRRITASAQKVATSYTIIFVNDGSPDDSFAKACALQKQDGHVEVVNLSRNFGHHKAIMTGIELARGDYTFVIDVDLEEEPELLESFADEIQKSECEIVFGVQHQRKGDIFERLSGTIFYKVFNFFSSTKIPENVVMARLFSRPYREELLKFSEADFFLAGVTELVGFKQKIISVVKHRNRQSSYSFLRRLDLMVDAITSFTGRPLYALFYIGALLFLLDLVFITYLFAKYIMFGVLPGWTSIVASVWFFGALIMFSIGLVGIYLSKIFIEVKQRPRSIVAEHIRKDSDL